MAQSQQAQIWIHDRADGAVVSLLVSPKSGSNRVGPVENGVLRVRVKAAAVEGAANAALTKVLAEATGISKSNIQLIAGHASRRKLVLFRGISASEVADLLGSEAG
jgi:uncharacterized protein